MDERAMPSWNIPHDRQVNFDDLSAHIHPADRDRVRAAFAATRAVLGRYERSISGSWWETRYAGCRRVGRARMSGLSEGSCSASFSTSPAESRRKKATNSCRRDEPPGQEPTRHCHRPYDMDVSVSYDTRDDGSGVDAEADCAWTSPRPRQAALRRARTCCAFGRPDRGSSCALRRYRSIQRQDPGRSPPNGGWRESGDNTGAGNSRARHELPERWIALRRGRNPLRFLCRAGRRVDGDLDGTWRTACQRA